MEGVLPYSNPYAPFIRFAVSPQEGFIWPPSMRPTLWQAKDDTGMIELNHPPELMVESLKVQRQVNDTAKFDLTLHHSQWGDLEYVLVNSAGRMARISYGYAGGAVSKTYFCQILEAKPSYTSEGTSIEISARGSSVISSETVALMSGGLSENTTARGFSYQGNISDIVSSICKEEGWRVGLLEPTAPLFSRDSNFSREAVLKRYTRSNMTAMAFIRQRLAPYAICARDGSGNYDFWLDEAAGSDGKPVVTAHFAPMRFSHTPSRIYTVYREVLGQVISFTPEINLYAAYTGAGGQIYSPVFDPLSKDVISPSVRPDVDLKGERTGEMGLFPTNLEQYAKAHNLPADQAENLLKFHQSDAQGARALFYTASMEIQGDPELTVREVIAVSMFNDRRELLDCSGYYLITEISDSVAGGIYTTSLTLIRNASGLGNRHASEQQESIMPKQSPDIGLPMGIDE